MEKESEKQSKIIEDAVNLLRIVSDAESNNRAQALSDLKFVGGDQWPVKIQSSRNFESRPCLTINKIPSFARQITNQQRQQRPKIKVHPVNNEADVKVAQVIEGITRHVELNSNADIAYDTAFQSAVFIGFGFWRITTDYISEDSFDQEIYVNQIDDSFSVYFDPNSTQPDGSDAEKCLITTVIDKKKFKQMYPDADDGVNFTATATGDSQAEWVTKEDIRIAEYFYTVREKVTLVQLSDGLTLLESELPPKEILDQAGVRIEQKRPSYVKKIKWCKLTAMQVLEEREWAGKYIPVVPCYGEQLIVDGKREKYGIVRFAKDPQRMYNFWSTSITESLALAPKAKWLVAEGQTEGHENEWALANIKSAPVLTYKQTDIDGKPAPAPQRIQPEPPPQGFMVAAAAVSDDLRTVMGIYDPAQQQTGNLSGKALNGQQMQIDINNFHFYDNLTRSIKHTGKIILDLIPKIYDTQRVMRIIGADGKPDLVNINEMNAVGEVLNDVTVGLYDVTMDTGPGYNSKREQAVEAMMPLMVEPQVFQAAGDLLFRNMDFPGADVIADRLAALNPLAKIDEKSDIPPQVQMKLLQLQKTVEEQQQQMAAMGMDLKYGMSKEQMKQDGDTKRELLRSVSIAHNTETMAEVKVNDQNTRAITTQNKTEIDAIVKLLLANMSSRDLQKKIDQMNAEQYAYAREAATDIHHNSSPFVGKLEEVAGMNTAPMPQAQAMPQPQVPAQQAAPIPQGVV